MAKGETRISKYTTETFVYDMELKKMVGTVSNDGQFTPTKSSKLKAKKYDSSWDAENALLGKGFAVKRKNTSFEISIPEGNSDEKSSFLMAGIEHVL